MSIHSSILKTVGHTPVVRLKRVAPPHANVFVKLESFNPLSSVKDRLAVALVEDAERRDQLKPGMTVVEATSGSTGIGLAMVCAVKDYRLVCVTRASFAAEVRRMMKFLGAKVIALPAECTPQQMKDYAFMLAERNGWFTPRQFENLANKEYHQHTTGQEIVSAFDEHPVDYFVCGYGTGGTISGAGAALKQRWPGCKVVVVEPDNAQQLRGQKWNPHGIHGWSPNYIPDNFDNRIWDHHLAVSVDDAMERSREVARREGLPVGFSGGATLHAALQVAEYAPRGANVLAMIADSAERYLATPLFAECDAASDTVPGMIPFEEFVRDNGGKLL